MKFACKLAAAAFAVALVAGCGGDDDSGAGGEGPDISDENFEDLTADPEVEVDAVDNSFRLPYIEVNAGTPITFVNKGRNDHNVLPAVEGDFTPIEAEVFMPDAEATLVFEEPGDYAYYCSIHGTPDAGMIGGIRVVE